MNYFTTSLISSWVNFTRTHKFKLIMRVSVLNIFLLICGLKLLTAAPTNAQDLAKIAVSLELRNETLRNAFAQIERQTDYRFVFQEFKGVRPLTIEKGTYNLKEALETILAKTGLHLAYSNPRKNYLIIYEVEPDRSTNKIFSDPTIVVPNYSAFTVAGIITEATTQTPIPGVSILVKGTTRGTTTDAEGNYAIDAETTDVLIFSSIGFRTYETEIAGKTTINIALETDATTIQEVVVRAGYWDVKEKENTGSIARVTSDQISNQPVVNSLQALQGRLTGVYITQQSGVPGSGFSIQIRGKNSLRGAGYNEPLYIIDGVPYTNTSIVTGAAEIASTSPFNNIDPASIESIEVLKDADATAIYGSQGANGVVLVTTKKGKSGKTSLSANFSSGVLSVPRMIKLLNTEQFIEMRKEAYANDGIKNYPLSAYDINGTWDQTKYTDWQKLLIGGVARMTNAGAALSGGSSTTRFLIGGTYVRQTTVYPGDFAYQRGAINFNLSHESENRKLQLLITANLSSDKNSLPTNDLIIRSIQLAPNAPKLYTETGELNWENSTWTNPLAQLLNKYAATTKGLFTNATLSYEIVRGLRIKANMGYNFLQMKELSTSSLKSISPATLSQGTVGLASRFGRSGTDTWVVEPQFELTRKLCIGDLTVFAATTFRESNRQLENLLASGYTVEALVGNLRSAGRVDPILSTTSQYRYNALYGRINYNIEKKYIINLTARRDGSSRFGPSRQFGNFGAIGVAWIFSNESFVSDNIPLISFGKLRGSFGKGGSDQIGDYMYLETYKSVSPYASTGTSIVPSRIPNPYYAWEVNKKLEAAIELGLFNDRIKLGINWYRNRSSNQLVGQSIPGTAGFLNFQSNLPATVQNHGWEFELSTIALAGSLFKWTSSINLTIPLNRLASFPNIQNSEYANTYEVGKSTFMTKKYRYFGVDSLTGVYKFDDKDQNGDPFGNADLQASGKIGQDYFGGFRNTITWRGFDLNLLLQFTKQTAINYIGSTVFEAPGMSTNQPIFVMQRWTEEGQNTSIQKFTTSYSTAAGSAYANGLGFGYYRSDMVISDASFVRLQNISLEWNLPKNILKKTSLGAASFYVQGQNLFTLTNYYGFDPETASFFTLPTLRVVIIGAKISI
jgi:TonB-dependent starch-binding outer membrane protein SusC